MQLRDHLETRRKYTLSKKWRNTNITQAHWEKLLIISFHHKHERDGTPVADEFNRVFSSFGKNAANAAACLAAENNTTLQEPSSFPQIQASKGLFNFKLVTCEDVRRIRDFRLRKVLARLPEVKFFATCQCLKSGS